MFLERICFSTISEAIPKDTFGSGGDRTSFLATFCKKKLSKNMFAKSRVALLFNFLGKIQGELFSEFFVHNSKEMFAGFLT